MKKINLFRIIVVLIILLIILTIILVVLIKFNVSAEGNYYISNTEIHHNSDDAEISGIKKYDCNEIQYTAMNIEDLISVYFNDYKSYILMDPERAYNLLDKEYRDKRFGDIEEYKTYVSSNKEKILNSKLKSYQVKGDENNARYVCLDQYGNYYIFTETAIMDYTVILDTYTIDLPEFTEKYNNGTEQQKVALNIEKFIQAVNTKDYKYAYNCLADSFKNNYFKTQAEFENYARENFYENSTVEYNQFEVQGDIYTYSVILKDKISGEQKAKTFIMKLGEETDFEMSFNR